MTDLHPDAAFKIARWCWPEAANAKTESDYAKKDRAIGQQLARDWPTIRAAELVLIERGLAEEYGRKLLDEICDARDTWSENEAASLCATAPLDARCRALLAVIEKQEAKK